jgi:hypothetical protein
VFLGIVLVMAGLCAVAVARHQRERPPRSAEKATRVLGETRSLRQYFRQHREATGGDRWGEFSTLLPYAIALGAADEWTQAFADTTVPEQARSWWNSRVPAGREDRGFLVLALDVCTLAPAPPAPHSRAGSDWTSSGSYSGGDYPGHSGGMDVGGGGGGGDGSW